MVAFFLFLKLSALCVLFLHRSSSSSSISTARPSSTVSADSARRCSPSSSTVPLHRRGVVVLDVEAVVFQFANEVTLLQNRHPEDAPHIQPRTYSNRWRFRFFSSRVRCRSRTRTCHPPFGPSSCRVAAPAGSARHLVDLTANVEADDFCLGTTGAAFAGSGTTGRGVGGGTARNSCCFIVVVSATNLPPPSSGSS